MCYQGGCRQGEFRILPSLAVASGSVDALQHFRDGLVDDNFDLVNLLGEELDLLRHRRHFFNHSVGLVVG